MSVRTARNPAGTAVRLLAAVAAVAAFAVPAHVFSASVGGAAPAPVDVAGEAPPPVGDGPIKPKML